MKSSSQIIGRSPWLIGVVCVGVVLWVGGWGSIFAQTDTEREAEGTLRDLKINMVPGPNIPMPEVYKTPPKIVEQIVGGLPEWKLFYFCRHHPSDKLKEIVHEQFATKLFDKKGKETKMVDYTVSSNPLTNQLIVRCPTKEDAEAVLELLDAVDVQPIQVKIECLISEIYADKTFDRETTIDIKNLMGENVTMTPGGLPFGTDVRQLIDEGGALPAPFPGASLREVVRSRMGLNIGYLSLTHNFTLLIDLLESKGYLKILMNPTLSVVNGGTAKVSSSQMVPLDRVTMVSTQADYLTTSTKYEDVVDSLEITAHVFADGYIGLETSILLGSKNTPEGVKQIPIITKKQIDNKENRIRHGESLIIGGMRKTMEFGVVRGVPILKDIPLIGFLFSGEDTEKRAVETIFILTPTISTDGRPKEEVIKEIQRKHEPSSPDGLSEMITDPFGFKARQKERDRKLRDAEQSRIEAEVDKAQARIDVREANERTEKAEAERNRIETEAQKIETDAQKASAEANTKAKAAEEAKAAADKEKTDAAKTKAEADKLMAEAQKTKADAEKTMAQASAKTKAAEETKTTADKATTDAKKAQAEAEAKAKAAEEAKATADKETADAKKARAEAQAKAKAAEKAKQEAEAEKEKAADQQTKAKDQEPNEEAEKATAKDDKA